MTIARVSMSIPFHSQLVDPSAPDFAGFRSLAEATHWQDRGCGIACLRMILEALNPAAALPRYGELVYEGLDINAYCERGWIHEGLVRLAAAHGVSGRAFRGASPKDVAGQILHDRPCIVSITAAFAGARKEASGRLLPPGGHLAVAFGYSQDEGGLGGFLVHHPSRSPQNNWQGKMVDRRSFELSFSGNFMAFGSAKASIEPCLE
jgi:hypothetical protein